MENKLKLSYGKSVNAKTHYTALLHRPSLQTKPLIIVRDSLRSAKDLPLERSYAGFQCGSGAKTLPRVTYPPVKKLDDSNNCSQMLKDDNWLECRSRARTFPGRTSQILRSEPTLSCKHQTWVSTEEILIQSKLDQKIRATDGREKAWRASCCSNLDGASEKENDHFEAYIADENDQIKILEHQNEVAYRWENIEAALEDADADQAVVLMRSAGEKNWSDTLVKLGKEYAELDAASYSGEGLLTLPAKARAASDGSTRLIHILHAIDDEDQWRWRQSDQSISEQWGTFYQTMPRFEHAPSTLEVLIGPKKCLWQQTPQVIASGQLPLLNKQEINFQEAIFEVLTSQASYIHSLTILQNHYMKNVEKAIPETLDWKTFDDIFRKVRPIIKAANKFYESLLQLWENDVMMKGMSEVVDKYIGRFGQLYVSYARHTQDMVQHFHDERESNPKFEQLTRELGQAKQAEGLPLYSFLNLPLQRIARMPLLFRHIVELAITPSSCEKYTKALETVNKCAENCNEEMKKMKNFKEMLKISQELLKFSYGVPAFPLFKSHRFLVLRSLAKKITQTWYAKNENVELFLFNDYFLYTKNKNHNLEIMDYCRVADLSAGRPTGSRRSTRTMQFVMSKNSKGYYTSFVMEFLTAAERDSWLSALAPITPCCHNDDCRD